MMASQDPTQTLIESFSALADEVQDLIDHKTILQHKLLYAAQQYQYLADKYAPAAPETSETLAKLQLPPDLHHPGLATSLFVPLPKRGQSDDTQHQIALLIREGRKAAQLLSAAAADGSGSSKETSSGTTMTTVSTVMEQDFTVEGKKGKLECPFSAKKPEADPPAEQVDGAAGVQDSTPHRSGDPICAAMFEEATAQPASTESGALAKCPIRFLDQHSPEEIAHYVETHKHQIPRSHEVCVRRYQKNEEQIRKLDAKYGNLVTMIKDLSHLHQPMLPSSAEAGAEAADAAAQEEQDDLDRASNKRVATWAQGVTSVVDDPERTERDDVESGTAPDRESHFDRPLKEVRVGESPTRPWGISVPIYEATSVPGQEDGRPPSPPPAPVRMPSPQPSEVASKPPAGIPGHGQGLGPGTGAAKCPFDHSKLIALQYMRKEEDKASLNGAVEDIQRPFTPLKRQMPPPPTSPPPPAQPAFINPPDVAGAAKQGTPQMLFTGPVFIGYPMEQALQLMRSFQGSS